VSLTGCGSSHRPSRNRAAHTATSASTDRPKTTHGTPSEVMAAVGRNRSSGPPTTTVVVRAVGVRSSATSRSPRPSCHSSQATTVVAP
jgi:hypothetical protein